MQNFIEKSSGKLIWMVQESKVIYNQILIILVASNYTNIFDWRNTIKARNNRS